MLFTVATTAEKAVTMSSPVKSSTMVSPMVAAP